MTIALFDLDGSLADFDSAMKRDMYKLASPHEINEGFACDEIYKEDKAYLAARGHLIRSQPGWWRNLEPLEDGFAILTLAQFMGFDCQILTKGPTSKPQAWAEKIEWVHKHVHPQMKVTITADKGMVYGRVLYDDWPGYVEAWLKFRPRGLVIMPDRPYNKDFCHPQALRWTGQNYDQVKEALTRALGTI